MRQKAVIFLLGSMEVIVLGMVCLAPWAFGAVHPGFEFFLYVTLAVLAALWGVRMLLEWQFTWHNCPVALCLAGLFLIGVWQIIPLPRPLLGWVAPGTVRLYEQLLPQQQEVLPSEGNDEAVGPPAGSTISLYPGTTRDQLVRLLAVLLLFAVVRNNIASAAALRRLSIVAVANGALLAFYALVQFFSSSDTTLYWSFPALNHVFGPFICKNHFPFYVNMCVGLGVGLLLAARFHGPLNSTTGEDAGHRWFHVSAQWLHDPQSLWLCVGVALMASSTVFSLSRGGFLSLAGATVASVIVALASRSRLSGLGMTALIAAMAFGLVAWYGFDRVEARLETLWQGQSLQESRLDLWRRTAPLVQHFPIFGTGYGTFPYIEPIQRSNPAEVGWLHENAHNDYLELLIEGGFVGLLVGLLGVVMICRYAYRAIHRYQGHPAGALAFGAFFAFATVVIHSLGDFGLHIPAIAVLATVICAHVSALGGPTSRTQSGRGEPPKEGSYVFRLGGLAPLTGAAVVVVLGLVICLESRKWEKVYRLRHSASQSRTASSSDREREIGYLEAALRLAPQNARVHFDLAQAHFETFEEQLTLDDPTQREREERTRRHLMPALRHFILARNLCPLMPIPHLRLAANVARFKTAEARSNYLERAKLLAPFDPNLWYQCGRQELLDGQKPLAWSSWRRCLELIDRYLPDILEASAKQLGTPELIERVLPDKPELLLAAALRLHPQSDALEHRKPFLERALFLLQNQAGPTPAKDLRLKGLIHVQLSQWPEAMQSYRAALAQQSDQVNWRYELAHLLFQQGHLQEARQELLTILAQQPGHAQARELFQSVTRRIAERL